MPADQFFILLAVICLAPKLTDVGAMIATVSFLGLAVMLLIAHTLARLLA